jgi:peptide deformylase
MKKIVQQENPILRKIAEPIDILSISKPETQKIIDDMFKSLASQKDGVALAAPQIAYSKRIFVISSYILDAEVNIPLVYINPKIIKRSKDKKNMEEGCLSCRWWYGKAKRSTRVTVEAYDKNGKQFTIEGRGLVAQIFQHEIDHLDGVLFVDHAKDLKEIQPEQE